MGPIIFGQIFAYSAFSDSHFASPGSVSGPGDVVRGSTSTAVTAHEADADRPQKTQRGTA
jgi:hypothetical protein